MGPAANQTEESSRDGEKAEEMRMGLVINGTVALAWVATIAQGQAPGHSTAGRSATMLVSSSADRARPLTGSAVSAGEILREIDDPGNGDRWLLVDDASHPGGPGLLLRAGEAVLEPKFVEPKAGFPVAAAPLPIIHAGDRIIVERHTAIVDARLEAVAMNPAWAGSALNVRLTAGGQVLRARATALGRAVLVEETR